MIPDSEKFRIAKRLLELQRAGKIVAWVNSDRVRIDVQPYAHWERARAMSWATVRRRVDMGGYER